MMKKSLKLNNNDRNQWIDNDEGLYGWFLSSRMSKDKFIRENKYELDKYIFEALNTKPAEKTWRDYR